MEKTTEEIINIIYNNPKIFKDLEDKYKDDYEIAMIAVLEHYENIKYISKRLKDDYAFNLAILKSMN